MESEQARHFGVMTSAGEPKPSYYALQTLTTTFDGYQFVRRLATTSKQDFLLLFKKGQSGILASWTISDPHAITFPRVEAGIPSVDFLGKSMMLNPDHGVLTLQLTDSPQYLLLPKGFLGNEDVSWKPDGTFFRLDKAGHGEIPVTIQNPSNQAEAIALQATLNGNIIGQADITLNPNENKTTNLPLDIIRSTSDQVDFFVKVTISNQGNEQTAWVWEQKK
jgi:hypothetical protein